MMCTIIDWTGNSGCQVKLSSVTMKVFTALEAGGFMDPLKWKLLRRLTAKPFGSALSESYTPVLLTTAEA